MLLGFPAVSLQATPSRAPGPPQATEPIDEPNFSVVTNDTPDPVDGLRVRVEGWCGNFANQSMPKLPPGQLVSGRFRNLDVYAHIAGYGLGHVWLGEWQVEGAGAQAAINAS